MIDAKREAAEAERLEDEARAAASIAKQKERHANAQAAMEAAQK